MTKVLIFGLPRTATTAIQLELGQRGNLESLKEPFCGDLIADDVYAWARKQDNCVMKLLTTNLLQMNTAKIDPVTLIRQGFTNVVVTQRNNFTECCISLYYAERIVKKYHYEKADPVICVPFSVDLEFVDFWLAEVGAYYKTLEELKQHQIAYEVFDYDQYLQHQSQTIAGYNITGDGNLAYVHPEINYRALCNNYQEVNSLIEEYVKRI